MEKEMKNKIIENMVKLQNGLKVVNLTSINLFFDDKSIIPRGNKELLDFFLPVPVTKETIKKKFVEIDAITYMPNEIIYDEEFLNFIEDNDIYFIGSHITCATYRHPRFIMTQIKYRNDGKKLAYANKFTTIS